MKLPTALVVTDRRLLPAYSGNRGRILSLLRALRHQGWTVVLVGVDGPSAALAARVDHVCTVDAPPFAGGDLARFDVRPFRRAVDRAAAAFDPAVAVAQYAWLGPALAGLGPRTARWIDCHDVLHERCARFTAAGLDPWTVCTPAQEAALLAHADLLITCQHRDVDALRALVPTCEVECAITPTDLPPAFERRRAVGQRVLAVGARHAGNDGIRVFARDAWPRVVGRVPSATLRIVGGAAVDVEPQPSLERVGPVDDILQHYAAASVVVCPVTTGSGVKTKMLEALRLGKAVVATRLCEEGLPAAPARAWIAADTLAGCADAVGEVLEDDATRASLEDAAYAYGAAHLSFECFCERIAAFLGPREQRATRLRSTPRPQADQGDAPARPISVVVRHVGNTEQLRGCLRALRTQSCAPAIGETLVVESAHARVDARVAREFASLTVLGTDDPGGPRLLADALGMARGRIVAVIDSDCRPQHRWLERMSDAALAHGGPCVVFGRLVRAARPSGRRDVHCYEHLTERRRDARADARSIADVIGCAILRGVPAAETDLPVLRARDAVVVLPLRSTLAGLRERVLRHAIDARIDADARSAARGALARLREEWRQAWTAPRLHFRDRVAVAALALRACFWRSLAAPRYPTTRPRAPGTEATAAAGNDLQARPLSLRSISVIVPCFGWPASLVDCVESLRRQQVDVPVEILVVINGPDARPAQSPWTDVTLLHEPRRGPAAARNAGVRAARGDVIGFIDADCTATTSWLAGALASMRSGGAARIIAGAITRSGARRNWVSFYDSVTYLQQERYVASGNFVTANLIVHRAVFDAIGPFDESFNEAAFEDWDWARRARDAGVPVAFGRDAVIDHPCMTHGAELRAKIGRLTRGDRIMQQKLGRALPRRTLWRHLHEQLRRGYRAGGLRWRDRARLMCVGAAVALWNWDAGRRTRV